MIGGETVLAVIPARSGSKRVPFKNFRLFRGKPLFMWTLEQAAASRYIDSTKLSLDSDRPPELCTDTATSEDVLRYHLKQFPHDWIVLLQPTSPLRTVEDIDGCIEYATKNCLGCISVDHWGKTTGSVYVARATWIATQNFSDSGPLYKYEIPESRSLDIDNPEDFDK